MELIANKTMWEVWRSSDVFKTLSCSFQTHQARLPMKKLKLERSLYKLTSALASLKQVRKTLFASGRQLDHNPPTSGAMLQHTKRAVYEAGHVWGKH